VSILKRKVADANSLKRARELYKDLFSQLGREEEDAWWPTSAPAWASGSPTSKATPSPPHCPPPGQADIDAALTRIAQQLAIRDSFAFIEACSPPKTTGSTRQTTFTTSSTSTKPRSPPGASCSPACSQFADNREALNKVPQAATALAELTQIRDNPKPYAKVNRIEPLLATVTSVNEQLAQEKREKALLSIDAKLAEVQKQAQRQRHARV
jgi:hypothetical protein